MTNFTPDLSYMKALIGSGLDSVSAARRECGGRVFTPPLTSAAWKPVAIGTALGAVGSRLAGNRGKSSMLRAGLIGGAIGFGAAAAWASRAFARRASSVAVRAIHEQRDAHWLATHPIDYA